MTLDLLVSPDFGGGGLPCDLSSLIGPKKVIAFQFVQLFLAAKIGDLLWKLLILFIYLLLFLNLSFLKFNMEANLESERSSLTSIFITYSVTWGNNVIFRIV